MPLVPGDKLGPYEILSAIGKGGMGEVFKAHDSRLGRDVAIKVSATQFSERFEREARAIAALNHPNICTLFDVGPNYLVMEFVEGESLKGPLPLATAILYARQITSALEAAHEKAITHRDLKPGNIMLTPDGVIKVLDFGLAKFGGSAPTAISEDSPTLSMAATQAGTILGTAAYMAPEQARGKPVDKRADIWAFGVVFHEILTGQRLFKGEDLTETLAAVVMRDPDLTPVPHEVRRLLHKCLQKDPKKRLRDIGDVWDLLDEPPAPAATAALPPAKSSKLPWIAAALATAAALAVTAYFLTRSQPQPLLRKVALVAPEGSTYDPGSVPMVSPDGRLLMMKANVNGQASIWVRDPAALSFRMLPGTEGVNLPFWSPDSKSIAFFADGKLKRVDVAGGPPITLCNSQGFGRGGSWSPSGVILFSPDVGIGILRIPEAGGTPTPVTSLDAKSGIGLHRSPWFLPDGRHFLYSAISSDRSKSAVYVGDADAQPAAQSKEAVVTVNSNVAYGWPGHILYVRDNTLMAQPFDPSVGKTTGAAVPLAERIDMTSAAGLAQFSVSQTGVLAYSSGGGGAFDNLVLTWVSPAGVRGDTVGRIGAYEPAISPDGKRIAYTRSDPRSAYAIFVLDLDRGGESRVSSVVAARTPVWSPAGDRLAFNSLSGSIFVKQLAASTPEESLANGSLRAYDWSRDGNFLLANYLDPTTQEDIYVVPLTGGKTGDTKPYPYINSKAGEHQPKLSPNGRWLAYTSDETGSAQIFVESFPQKGGKWQISVDGGSRPVWSRDGKQLFFVDPQGGKIYATTVAASSAAAFNWSPPKPLFDVQSGPDPSPYDVAPDGRFLLPQPGNRSATSFSVTLVLDWHAALKK
ncbi:MAG: protein kinase [Acidobacteriota bacterium]